MGSEQFAQLEKAGITRSGGENCEGPPESFALIGLDISAEALIKRYPGETAAHRRACAIIRGVRDRTRTVEPPPAWFIASLGEGQEERVTVANLGPDNKGRVWVVIVKGRQRTMALRAWNEKQKPHDRRNLLASIAGFRHTSAVDAELTALESNAASNLFVAMRPSQTADHAAMMRAKGRAVASIAVKLGLRDEEAVRHHLALAALCPAVWGAVDAGTYPIAECMALVTFDGAGNATTKYDEEEQARRVARATAAPKGANGAAARKARDDAAPPRAKSLGRPKLQALADAFGALPCSDVAAFTGHDLHALLQHVLGADGALHAPGVSDTLRATVMGAAKGKGIEEGEASAGEAMS